MEEQLTIVFKVLSGTLLLYCVPYIISTAWHQARIRVMTHHVLRIQKGQGEV